MSPSQLHDLLNSLSQWRNIQGVDPNFGLHTIIAWFLCFVAASISSAGGVGGGSLYLPILNLIAGMDLKAATAFSAFMVTGGSVSNVLFNLFFSKSPAIIDYEIALLSEPSMLLGVSIGVFCNVMFPEWLITSLFAIFLACSTYKTCKAGCKNWKAETDGVKKDELCYRLDEEKVELLIGGKSKERGEGIPWRKMVVLLVIWVSFFVLHVLVGSKDGKSMKHIKPCGVAYWLVTLLQAPITIAFTVFVLYDMRRSNSQSPDQRKDGMGEETLNRVRDSPMAVFPLAALLSGIMGGLFGIGGGLLINPLLLQIGVPPQVTAATTSFMVLFSSSMSLVQFLILGMKAIEKALVFSALCFIASIVGLLIIQKAIERSGRASLIVFSVSTVMALSTISITCFGAIDVWRDYTSGKNMGFKLPC